MEDIECHSVQDRLLIMLLERVEQLEQRVHDQNKMIDRLLTYTTSQCFSFYVNGCVLNNTRTTVTTVIHDIANTINSFIPIDMLYGKYYFDNTGCCICIHTKSPWLFKTIKESLDTHLKTIMPFIIINSWQMHTTIPEDYKALVVFDNNAFQPI